jgi:hypothetical protein
LKINHLTSFGFIKALYKTPKEVKINIVFIGEKSKYVVKFDIYRQNMIYKNHILSNISASHHIW